MIVVEKEGVYQGNRGTLQLECPSAAVANARVNRSRRARS